MGSKRAVMKCWVCAREARGFGHADTRYQVGRARRYPVDWVFCSQRCQRCFHKLYEAGARLLNRGDVRISVKEGDVIDPSEAEMAAMLRCLKPLGEAANEVGMERALSTYSQDEALLLINAVVTTYVEAMVQAHEAGKYPPLRMLGQESYG
jgi:hypothetical protein